MDWLRKSIVAKLDRAEYHLMALNELASSGAVTDLVETRTDRDRQGRVRLRIKEVAEIPDEWHVWIGECVHDMRSALDHLAYGLNIIGSGQDPPPNWKTSQFPIYSDRATYRKGGRRGRSAAKLIAHFPRGAPTRIERLQPYHGRKHDRLGPRRLAELADLSQIDKHRRFPITASSPKTIYIPDRIQGHPVVADKFRYGLLKPDTTILWLEVPSLPRSVKEPYVDFRFSAAIEFEGASANPPVRLLAHHEPVAVTLRHILGFIDRRVLPEFERWVPGLSVSRNHA